MCADPTGSDVTQEDANRLCHAASCVFFALIHRESAETGAEVLLPWHCSSPHPLPSPTLLDETLVEAAVKMLLRLGIVAKDEDGTIRVVLTRPDPPCR